MIAPGSSSAVGLKAAPTWVRCSCAGCTRAVREVWPERSKDQERPARMGNAPKILVSLFQRVASTRVSASPPPPRCSWSVCCAVCVVAVLFLECNWRATFSGGVARRHVACIRNSFNQLWPALICLRSLSSKWRLLSSPGVGTSSFSRAVF